MPLLHCECSFQAAAECWKKTGVCAAHIPVLDGGFCLLPCYAPKGTSCLLYKVCYLSGTMIIEECVLDSLSVSKRAELMWRRNVNDNDRMQSTE